MRVNDNSASRPMHQGLADRLLHALGYIVVLATIGLSLWAVTYVQLASRPDDEPVRYWYATVFIVCELWVAVGLMLIIRRFAHGAWLSGLLALVVWVPAVGLSAVQEVRYHSYLDNQIDVQLAPQKLRHEQTADDIEQLELQLKSMSAPTRSVGAIDAELQRYRPQPNTYRTRLAQLTGERADLQAYLRLSERIAQARQSQMETVESATVNAAQLKLGQSFSVPVLELKITNDVMLWLLVSWMMLVKATGVHLLSRSHGVRPSPKQSKSRAEVRVL